VEPPRTELRELDDHQPGEYERLYASVLEQREAERAYQPIHPTSGWRALARRIWAPLAALVAFLVKFGAVIFKLKFLTLAGSMIVSIGAYALLGGWWFGVGLVGLIFVHELGHALEAKRQGLKTGWPVFIPFMGAVIALKQMPPNAWREAQIGLAGPILGSVGAAAVWGLGEYYDSRFLQALAFVGFSINLFNLLPVVPLDGGRAVAAIHPALWAAGVVALLALAVRWHNPLLYIIVILGALELWRRWKLRDHPETQTYYRVKPWQRVTVALVYVGLALVLVLGMHATHVPRDF
jgi:Zn-dependent protease